mmetsp:Transcript_18194/g.57164  ORF Transcript_18194/g.57164 Transcript_18194/m.57164 type:complete len:103 (-) Transcript_18194:39-347(-)
MTLDPLHIAAPLSLFVCLSRFPTPHSTRLRHLPLTCPHAVPSAVSPLRLASLVAPTSALASLSPLVERRCSLPRERATTSPRYRLTRHRRRLSATPLCLCYT